MDASQINYSPNRLTKQAIPVFVDSQLCHPARGMVTQQLHCARPVDVARLEATSSNRLNQVFGCYASKVWDLFRHATHLLFRHCTGRCPGCSQIPNFLRFAIDRAFFSWACLGVFWVGLPPLGICPPSNQPSTSGSHRCWRASSRPYWR